MKEKVSACIAGMLILAILFLPIGSCENYAFPRTKSGTDDIVIDEASYFVVVSRRFSDYGSQTINYSYSQGYVPIEINNVVTLQAVGPGNATLDFPYNATYLISEYPIMSCYWQDNWHFEGNMTEPGAFIFDLKEINYGEEYDTCDIQVQGDVSGYLYDDSLYLESTGKQFTLEATLENPLSYYILVVEPRNGTAFVEIDATPSSGSSAGAGFAGSIMTPIAGFAALLIFPAAIFGYAMLRMRREKENRRKKE